MPALLTRIWMAPILEQGCECGGGRDAVGDVEGDGFGAAAGGEDFTDDRVGLGAAAAGMDDDVMPGGGEAPADRGADAAAAAGDQGTFHGWTSVEDPGVEDDGGATFDEAIPGVTDREPVEDVVGVAGETFSLNIEFARQIVEARDMQAHAAHAGQVALTRPVRDPGQQGAMQRHRLGGIFDAGGGAQASFGTQRVGRIGMTDGAAGNEVPRPVDRGSEQAHAALVRDTGGDGGVV